MTITFLEVPKNEQKHRVVLYGETEKKFYKAGEELYVDIQLANLPYTGSVIDQRVKSEVPRFVLSNVNDEKCHLTTAEFKDIKFKEFLPAKRIIKLAHYSLGVALGNRTDAELKVNCASGDNPKYDFSGGQILTFTGWGLSSGQSSFRVEKPGDKIELLINQKLKKYGWQWRTGPFSILKSSSSASIEDVLAEIYKMSHISNYKILEKRNVLIEESKYTAVLINKSGEDTLVLLQYNGHRWKSRSFRSE